MLPQSVDPDKPPVNTPPGYRLLAPVAVAPPQATAWDQRSDVMLTLRVRRVAVKGGDRAVSEIVRCARSPTGAPARGSLGAATGRDGCPVGHHGRVDSASDGIQGRPDDGRGPSPLTIVIASPFEPELVERVRAAEPRRTRVIYEPDLVPTPKFTADHFGTPPVLRPADLRRWLDLLAGADVLLDFDWYAPSNLPRNAPNVRWIQATRSGVGQYLRAHGLDRAGIVITNCAGVHAEPLVEFVVLGLLHFLKDVPRLLAATADRAWTPWVVPTLAGRRVLLVGLGGLGTAIAATLAGLGVEVWGMRRSPAPPPPGVARVVVRAELEDALRDVDAVVLACPATPETHHLIGARELAAVRPGALLVNVARGAVVDEAALADALHRGHLGGAALDVFEVEPLPASSPLWGLPNVLIAPHTMSIVEAENPRIIDLFLDNLGRYLEGRPLRNVFQVDRGY